jgi:hypothetical protein
MNLNSVVKLGKDIARDCKTVSKIRYTTCSNNMHIEVVQYQGETWCAISDGTTLRWLRLLKPDALSAVAGSFGYLDNDGCLNKDMGVVTRGRRKVLSSPPVNARVSAAQRAITGVPQRTATSGICWFCSMCFVMLFEKNMRELFQRRAPHNLAEKLVGVLQDPASAEDLRVHLFNHLALGDDPRQDPLLDGQNGFVQLCILLSALDIPVVRLLAPEMLESTDHVLDQHQRPCPLRNTPRSDETSLLVVRVFRTRWSPTPRFVHRGRRYRLTAALIGSEHCGHQVAVSTVALPSCSTWALSDSDATRKGIGPMYWSVRRKSNESKRAYLARWRRMWSDMIPATIFGGNDVCDLNPINRSTYTLQKYSRTVDDNSGKPGVVNTDFIYMSQPV